MNKENMQKLIDAIKFDGQKKFNMSAFIGKLNDERFEHYVFEDEELASKYPASRVLRIEEGTDIFNCTSMGCIAGFATALANNWKAPSWLAIDDHSKHVSNFENASNEFLGFTWEEGRNLYFGDSRSIWKWLMQNEPERYDLELEEYGSMDNANEEGIEWWEDELTIDFSSIDYLTAIDVLTRIMNGEIGLADKLDHQPYYVEQEAVVS
jgi:hypothetical protein